MRDSILASKTEWRKLLRDNDYLFSAFLAFVFLGVCLVVNYFAGVYATVSATSAVGDLVLDHLPEFNVSIIFIYGSFFMWVLTAIILLGHPKMVPYVIKSIGLFLLVRSSFVILTHIGPFPHVVPADPYSLMAYFTFGGDLFFSGHTGTPFLLGLLFWDNRWLRTFYIISSGVFGAAVLMGHLHYSIDVYAAFFITYGIYKISRILFAKDYSRFALEKVV